MNNRTLNSKVKDYLKKKAQKAKLDTELRVLKTEIEQWSKDNASLFIGDKYDLGIAKLRFSHRKEINIGENFGMGDFAKVIKTAPECVKVSFNNSVVAAVMKNNPQRLQSFDLKVREYQTLEIEK